MINGSRKWMKYHFNCKQLHNVLYYTFYITELSHMQRWMWSSVLTEFCAKFSDDNKTLQTVGVGGMGADWKSILVLPLTPRIFFVFNVRWLSSVWLLDYNRQLDGFGVYCSCFTDWLVQTDSRCYFLDPASPARQHSGSVLCKCLNISSSWGMMAIMGHVQAP